MEKQAPILIEPTELYSQIGHPSIKIINICESSEFKQVRIPGSIHISSSELYEGSKPAPGLVPSEEHLKHLISRLGLPNIRHVIAYDDEGGGHASRLVWTLYLVNYRCASVLNGGIQSWLAHGLPTIQTDTLTKPSNHMNLHIDDSVIADQEYIKRRLGKPDLILLDARTPEEYQGQRVLAKRGGHIPGAINFNWLDSLNTPVDFQLKGKYELEMMLLDKNITPDNEIVVYCQTHHRSAQSWMMLRYLDYPRVRGYPGSWSEWGNDLNVPIE